MEKICCGFMNVSVGNLSSYVQRIASISDVGIKVIAVLVLQE